MDIETQRQKAKAITIAAKQKCHILMLKKGINIYYLKSKEKK